MDLVGDEHPLCDRMYHRGYMNFPHDEVHEVRLLRKEADDAEGAKSNVPTIVAWDGEFVS